MQTTLRPGRVRIHIYGMLAIAAQRTHEVLNIGLCLLSVSIHMDVLMPKPRYEMLDACLRLLGVSNSTNPID